MNGAAERLIRTLKEALRKSSKPPKQALQEFLLMYRRTPARCGYSPSELLNGRQIRTKINALIPVPLQLALRKKSIKKIRSLKVGDPVYALYYGPRRNRDPRWVPGVIVQARGTRLFHVRIVPNGPTWKRHIDQICWRYASPEDDEPGDLPTCKFPVPDNVPVFNLTFPHLIPCRNMDVITQEDLNETEDLHFATDNLDINVFPHYLFYRGGRLLCYITCVIILCWKHRIAPCTPCLLKLCKPRKRTCFWRNATSRVTTNPDYAITIGMALYEYLKQVSGRFHSFHYILVTLVYRSKLKLNLVWKVVIIYIFKNTTSR